MNHVGASVVRIHSVHIRAPIHTDGTLRARTASTHARARNDENTRPSSLVYVRVKYCLLLVSSSSPPRLSPCRERGDKCRNLPLPPFSLLPPFLYPSIFTRVYLSASDTKVSHNCTSGHKRRLSPIVFTETAFPLRTHRVSKPRCRSRYMTPFPHPF